MLFETERLYIRNFHNNDVVELYDILSDEETMENIEPPYDLEKVEIFLKRFCIEQNGAVAAIQKETNKLTGYILFNELEKGIYEIGWIFHRFFWRKGYAYEACSALISYAFNQRNADKIFAETTDTIKSIALMKKLGMKQVGIPNPSNNMYTYEFLNPNKA